MKYYQLIPAGTSNFIIQKGDRWIIDGEIEEPICLADTRPFDCGACGNVEDILREIPAPPTWTKFSNKKPDRVPVVFAVQDGSNDQFSYYSFKCGAGWRPGGRNLHWMTLTPPIVTEAPVTVGDHQVQFENDGSVKVGCVKVSDSQMEEIISRRERAKKG